MIKKILAGLMPVLGFVLLSAQGCDGPGAKPNTHLVLDVSQPPLAETLGCKDGTWYIRILDRKIADDPKLTPDQKAKQAKTVCESPNVAKRYPIGGYYP